MATKAVKIVPIEDIKEADLFGQKHLNDLFEIHVNEVKALRVAVRNFAKQLQEVTEEIQALREEIEV